MSLLRLEEVVVCYTRAEGPPPSPALQVLGMEVAAGEILGIFGPNGSGKSTLLHTLAHLQRPEAGRVLLEGTDHWATGSDLLARRRCPALLQATVLLSRSVLDNAALGLRLRGVAPDQARQRARQALASVGLAGFGERRQDELSGGEQRRVAIARVLALDPELLVLDEPFAGLDPDAAGQICDLLVALNRQRGTTIVVSAHEIERAARLCTRSVSLHAGRVLPGALVNTLEGTLAPGDGGWTLTTPRGPLPELPADRFCASSWEGWGPVAGPVRAVLPAEGLAVSVDGPPSGAVAAVRPHGSQAAVRVRLDGGPVLRVLCDARATWALGQAVRLDVAPGAVRVLGR